MSWQLAKAWFAKLFASCRRPLQRCGKAVEIAAVWDMLLIVSRGFTLALALGSASWGCILSGSDFLRLTISTAVAVSREIFNGLVQFFSSPLFFIMLGIGFLIEADRLTDSAHPTFIFLLAILGVSIVLYGTGTQGAGSGQIGNVPIKVTVAGGAGVLAAIFGFGVAWLGPNIQTAFKVPHQYARIVLNLNGDNEIVQGIDLRTVYVTATSRDSRPLHVLTYEDRVEILVPVTYFPEQTGVCVNLILPPHKSVTGKPNCPVLTWSKNEEGPDGELITYVGVGTLPLVPPKATRIDEANNPTQQVSNDDFK